MTVRAQPLWQQRKKKLNTVSSIRVRLHSYFRLDLRCWVKTSVSALKRDAKTPLLVDPGDAALEWNRHGHEKHLETLCRIPSAPVSSRSASVQPRWAVLARTTLCSSHLLLSLKKHAAHSRAVRPVFTSAEIPLSVRALCSPDFSHLLELFLDAILFWQKLIFTI